MKLQYNSANLGHMLKRALEHHQAGRLEEAAREYDAVLREKPNHR